MPLLNTDMIACTKCERAFRSMILAFIFLMIDLRLAVFPDLLPDFLGWVILAWAFTLIKGIRSDIRKVRNICGLLAVFSLLWTFLSLALPWLPASAPKRALMGAGICLDAVIVTLEVYVVWWLCGLIMDIASACQAERLQQNAATRRRLYAGLAVTIFALRWSGQLLFLAGDPDALPGWVKSWGLYIVLGWFWIALVTTVALITLLCLMIGLLRRTADLCKIRASPPA